MLAPLVFVLAVVAAGVPAGPAPTPAAAPPVPANANAGTPLKEIGRVTSSAMCTAIVVRANSAIGAALRNDQTLTMAVSALRRADLDSANAIDKNKSMRDIERLANDLRMSAGNAEAQITKLREMSAEATDPERKAELKEFADALGGALFRQKRIGHDLQKMLAIIEGRDARAGAKADMAYAMPENRSFGNLHPYDFDPSHYNQMAQGAAKDLEERTLAILADESKAAEHIVGAVNGC